MFKAIPISSDEQTDEKKTFLFDRCLTTYEKKKNVNKGYTV